MTDAPPALLALLLVLSIPAMTVVAAGPSNGSQSLDEPVTVEDRTTPVEAEGTTNRLPVTGEVRSGYAVYGPDLGTQLASTDVEIRVDQEQYTITDSRFEEANNSERERMVKSAHSRLEDRISVLEEREERAVIDHANGDISERELLQTLMRNYHEAAILSDALADVDDRTERIRGYSLSTDNDQEALNLHRTDVREKIDESMQSGGSDAEPVVAIQTSETGYSISLIDGNYYTETTRFDNRNTSRESRIDGHNEAYDYVNDLYPWAGDAATSTGSRDFSTERLYSYHSTGHDQGGDLEVYLDEGTGEVYREYQDLSPDMMVQDLSRNGLLSEPVNATSEDDDLAVSLVETPADGPVEVTVTDDEGEPVESAAVSTDGFELGTTNADGTLWIIPPVGEYEVVVESGSDDVTATAGSEE
ncbi:carboxypeptidase-like regulatory domain-containing protein [Natrialbaceae archaeon GCM10025810]|uniref:carboxypeptidase-like regulatory domain-containing protein n=1 Tax=Halovalidus salilacus TaxID=3075124 RepID=UPI00361C1650